MTQKLDPKILSLNAHMVDAILEDCIKLGERARIVRAMLTGETRHVERVRLMEVDGQLGGVFYNNGQNATAQDVVNRRNGTTVDDLPEREWPQTYGTDTL